MVPVLAVPMDEMLPVLVIPEGKNPETLRKREYLEHRTQKGTESGSIRSTKPPNALSTRGSALRKNRNSTRAHGMFLQYSLSTVLFAFLPVPRASMVYIQCDTLSDASLDTGGITKLNYV